MTFLPDQLLPVILGRSESFLREEIENSREEITEVLGGTRILVIGAAGTIGAAFVRVLARYPMEALHLVDISENNLVEVVRDFRSSGAALPEDFRTYSIDFSGPEMDALLGQESYDFVMNFAALKHVRSERDPFTLMRLLEVNVLANDHLTDILIRNSSPRRVFAVSSDKAVRPANLMGASKAFMERIFLSCAARLPFSSARFANVAFSDGSLLDAFRQRINKGQPISAPSDVRRYFISSEEAGELCLLGCFISSNREIVFPEFRQEKDTLSFSEIARVFLEAQGLCPVECESEEEARELALRRPADSREWPCFFSASDTSGEKMLEEFADPGETVDLERFPNLGVVVDPCFHGESPLRDAIAELAHLRERGMWTKKELIELVRRAVPEMQLVEHDRDLDQKM